MVRNIRSGLVSKFAAGAVAAFLAGEASASDILETPQPVPYAAPIAPLGTTVFLGGSLKEDNIFGYLGFVHAHNGDLEQNGLLYRAALGFRDYEYATSAVAGGKVDGDLTAVDLALGYQWFAPMVRVAVFGGVDFQNYALSPKDPTNSTRGDAAGFKVQGEVETRPSTPYYGSAFGSYSTANEDYGARFRLGAKYGQLVIGPELALQGNDAYDEVRYGAFLKGFRIGGFESEVAVGYADTSGRTGPDSVYVGAGLSFAF